MNYSSGHNVLCFPVCVCSSGIGIGHCCKFGRLLPRIKDVTVSGIGKGFSIPGEHRFFKKCGSHLKMLGASLVKCSKFHAENV
jgi:hypothetical protein